MKKIDSSLQDRVLQARITKLEGALVREVRRVQYGEVKFTVHKIEGQPVRIVVEPVKESKVLNARDGLELEDSEYVPIKK